LAALLAQMGTLAQAVTGLNTAVASLVAAGTGVVRASVLAPVEPLTESKTVSVLVPTNNASSVVVQSNSDLYYGIVSHLLLGRRLGRN
jgi:hypothetical protein